MIGADVANAILRDILLGKSKEESELVIDTETGALWDRTAAEVKSMPKGQVPHLANVETDHDFLEALYPPKPAKRRLK